MIQRNVYRLALVPIMLALLLGAWGIRSVLAVSAAGGSLNSGSIPKYESPLVIPSEMPATGAGGAYDIEAIPHMQQILPDRFHATPVWTYAATDTLLPLNHQAFTVKNINFQNAQVIWRNNADTTKVPISHTIFLPNVLQTLRRKSSFLSWNPGVNLICRCNTPLNIYLFALATFKNGCDHPTRVVQQKGIEPAIHLIKALNRSQCMLELSTQTGDEDLEYPGYLERYAAHRQVEISFQARG